MSDRTIYFRLDETLRVAEATAQATSHHDSFVDQENGTKTGPALMWVKDAGTYLMSNASPRPDNDVIYGRAFAADGLLLKQPDDSRSPAWDAVWNTTREICGGDDFSEYFELDDLLPQLRAALADGWTHLVLTVSDETVDLTFRRDAR
jgi:hypothetical protein